MNSEIYLELCNILVDFIQIIGYNYIILITLFKVFSKTKEDKDMKKFLSLILITVILFNFSTCSAAIPKALLESTVPDNKYTTSAPYIIETNTIPEYSTFTVHYIDVGQGDAALILCDGKSMLIDGGKPKASNIIYTYLKNQEITCLDYIICSHPDDDHIGGLSAPLSNITVKNVYAPNIEADIKSYQSFRRKTEEQGLTIQHPACDDSFQFGSSTVDFLGPVTVSAGDRNNSSIVLKITYGDTSFVFTGDAEREEEQQILDKGYDLSATVLKVGHHGSRNSTTYPFLREIMPEYAVISVGKDNTYGHPTEDVLSKLKDASVKVYRTDMQGNIIATSDGKTVTITPSKNVDADTLSKKKAVSTPTSQSTVNAAPAAETSNYIGNQRSKKFHLPSCNTLPADHNRIYMTTRDEAIQKEYDPCQNCNP